MRRFLSIIAMAALAVTALAQTTRQEVYADLNRAGGVYYAYPAPADESSAAIPEGYTPFYISHFGRHGSRYLISDRDYTSVHGMLERADSAGILTAQGRDVKGRIEQILPLVRGRGGDLSPLGVRQHRGIAERMLRAYPQVFVDSTAITARSTTVPRCILSMDAFCERLKELNPTLQITRDASRRHLDSLNYHSAASNAFTANDGPWRAVYDRMYTELTRPDRLMAELVSSPGTLADLGIAPDQLMWGLYWIAVGMQDIDTDVTLMDVFTPDELYDLWQVNSGSFYMRDANYAPSDSVIIANAANYVADILHHADLAIATGVPGATLRFAHDGNLIPLAAWLGLEGCDAAVTDAADFADAWADWRVSPMAGNIQLVFFRSDTDPSDILVKVLHNERVTTLPLPSDVAPYYRWSDLRPYLAAKSHGKS